MKKNKVIKYNKKLYDEKQKYLTELLTILKRLIDENINTEDELMLYKVRVIDKLFS